MADVPLHVGLLAGPDTLDVYGDTLRHVCTGLIGEGVQVSIVGDAGLGLEEHFGPPVRLLTVPRTRILRPREHLGALGERLSRQGCRVLHALSESALRWLGMLRGGQSFGVVGTLSCGMERSAGMMGPAGGAVSLGAGWVEGGGGVAGWLGRLAGVDRYRQSWEGRLFVDRWVGLSSRVAQEGRERLGKDVEVVGLGTFVGEEISFGRGAVHPPGLLCTTPLVADCGVDRLVEAFGRVSAVDPRMMLFLCGEGPREGQIRRQVRELGLGERVMFTAVPVSWRDRVGAVDVFVEPGCGVQVRSDLVEAMAAGMCCVGVRGDALDVLEHGVSGQLVAAGDSFGLTDALRRIVLDERYAVGLAEGGQRRAREVGSAARTAIRLAGLYGEVARGLLQTERSGVSRVLAGGRLPD